MLGIGNQFQREIKMRVQKIVLTAFDCYCLFKIHNISENKGLELNLIAILDNLLQTYGQGKESKSQLYKSLFNFISLLRTDCCQVLAVSVTNTIQVI